MHRGVMFNFGSVKVCSPSICETCFSYDKDIWIAVTDYYNVLLHNCAIFIDSFSPINNFYSFVIFSLLIYAVTLLLNCLVLMPYLNLHFLSLRRYCLYLNIICTFI